MNVSCQLYSEHSTFCSRGNAATLQHLPQFTGFIAWLRNPWKCLNSVLKIQRPWKCLKSDKVFEMLEKSMNFYQQVLKIARKWPNRRIWLDSRCHRNALAAGALPQTPLRELTALHTHTHTHPSSFWVAANGHLFNNISGYILCATYLTWDWFLWNSFISYWWFLCWNSEVNVLEFWFGMQYEPWVKISLHFPKLS